MLDNSDFPLVSVVITGKNEQNTIEKCIISILNQSYPNFEIIYVDAKSSDNTIKKANQLKSLLNSIKKCKRYMTVSLEADFPSKGRNLGVNNAKGSIIAFTDADCVADQDWLTNLVRQLSKGIGIVGGPNIIRHFKNSRITNAIDSVLSTYLGSGGSPQFYKIHEDCDVYALPSCNMAIQKNLFEKVGKFNEKLRYNEDSDLCNRIRKSGSRILYSPSARIYHFIGIDSYNQFISYFHRYGYERGKNAATNLDFFTKFNVLSLSIVVAALSLLSFSFFTSMAFMIFILLITIVISVVLFVSLKIGIRNRSPMSFFLVLIIFPSLHIVYNIGFVIGYLTGIKKSRIDSKRLLIF